MAVMAAATTFGGGIGSLVRRRPAAVRNGIRNRREGWHDRHFSDAANALWVFLGAHCDDDGLDHRHIGGDRACDKSRKIGLSSRLLLS